jgi:PAS domain S-box-containing protein
MLKKNSYGFFILERPRHSTAMDVNIIFQSLPGILIVVDNSFDIVNWNKGFERQYGLTPEKKSSMTLADLLPLEADVLQSAVALVFDRAQSQELVVKATNMTRFKVQLIPVPAENIPVSHVLISLEQISDGRKSPELERSETLFESLFTHNPAALTISRMSDSRILSANESFLRLFDFNHESDVLGKTADELGLMTDPSHQQEILRLLKDHEKVVRTEGSIRTQKGNIRYATTSVIQVMLDNEPCMMAVMIDITERKLAEDRLKDMNAQLEELVRIKTGEIIDAEVEYHSVIEQATDGIFISDTTGKYLDVNPAASHIFGYSKEEFLKMTVEDLLFPEDIKSNPLQFSRIIGGESLVTSRTLRRKDGSKIPVEISAKMLTNGKVLGIVRDITERKKAEEEIRNANVLLELRVAARTTELEKKIQQLRESEDKFEKAFKASSAGITITRISDSKYVDVNDAFLGMIGFERDEVINHTSAELGIIVNIERREEVLKEVRDRGSVRLMEMTIRRKSGEHMDILASIETIVHQGEKFAINIINDITSLKKTQQKLETVNKELEAFSYSVSHDLRSPLRSIIGYTEVIREDYADTLNEEVKKHLLTIRNNASKMGRLIDDLLEFSKLGKQELLKTAFDTRAVVDKNIQELTPPSSDVVFEVGDLLPSWGNLAMINQVWLNLISNAIKYSSKREQPTIQIGSYQAGRENVFYIKDNGAGFNMAFSAKLFGVFHRLHKASEFPGTGVGLALVKRIVEKHGGRVWAEGVEGEGASFYFTLPVNEQSPI